MTRFERSVKWTVEKIIDFIIAVGMVALTAAIVISVFGTLINPGTPAAKCPLLTTGVSVS